jgi:hypothetical protein
MGEKDRTQTITQTGSWGLLWLLTYIGAAIYFVSISDGSFWGVVVGLLQALVWPVYVVYHVLVLLHA